MKVLRSVVFALGLLLVVSAVHAQSAAVSANIPFDFIVGKQVYPAGNYLLSSWGTVQGSILIQNRNESRGSMVLTQDCTKLEEAEKTVLIFHRYDDQYFLEQVWIKGNTTGRQFRMSKIETQLAKNHQDREEVNVAANVAAQRTH